MDLEHIRRTAIAAAYKGGKCLHDHFGNLSQIRKKGVIDLVTEADIASEKAIIETIRSAFPEHGILAEESGASNSAADLQWIIDPLDGTTNFAHSVDIFSVSIAFAAAGEILVGVILSPVSGELFTALKGAGATLNGRPIHVSQTAQAIDALLVTGFPYDKRDYIGPLLARYRNCLCACQAVRRLGSAALDLCFVACGRFDGFWEEHLNPWDTAAGVIIAREAGAVVTDFSGQPFTIDKQELLATNGHIHAEMRTLLKLEDSA